ncbi:hypothetical protein ACVJBD_007683 [Rhizobium mongolense]
MMVNSKIQKTTPKTIERGDFGRKDHALPRPARTCHALPPRSRCGNRGALFPEGNANQFPTSFSTRSRETFADSDACTVPKEKTFINIHGPKFSNVTYQTWPDTKRRNKDTLEGSGRQQSLPRCFRDAEVAPDPVADPGCRFAKGVVTVVTGEVIRQIIDRLPLDRHAMQRVQIIKSGARASPVAARHNAAPDYRPEPLSTTRQDEHATLFLFGLEHLLDALVDRRAVGLVYPSPRRNIPRPRRIGRLDHRKAGADPIVAHDEAGNIGVGRAP